MSRVENNSDFRNLVESAKTQGWKTIKTEKGHWKFLAPNGVDIVHTSGSPGDFRALKNFVARLRKAGFKTQLKR